MRNYLIIPAMPTPNGPLHVGHIGGPYLRADILARYLRQQGNQVTLLSGTDNFENYTYRQAITENMLPRDICYTYHPQIVNDLKYMNIHFDDFINPHDEKWLKKYKKWCFTLIDESRKSGKIAQIGDDLILSTPGLTALEDKGICRKLVNAYRRYIAKANYQNKVTTDCEWGIAVDNNKTLLSYSFIYAYYLLLSEYANKGNGNALSADSDTIVIATFGVDNTNPVLESVLGFSSINEKYKPIDYYIVNYFFYFEGKKFSTSDRHAIWVNDVKNMALPTDILRLYLASIDVSSSLGNFTLENYFIFQDKIQRQISTLINRPVKILSSMDKKSSDFLSRIKDALHPGKFKPHLAVQAIMSWMQMGEKIDVKSEEYASWLKAFEAAIYPFMPDLSEKIQHLMVRD